MEGSMTGWRYLRRTIVTALLVLVMTVALATSVEAGDWPQFRGPNRNGKADDTGLMEKWPEDGPELLWRVDDLGHGFTSAAVANGMVYSTGLHDKQGVISAYDLQGNLKWRESYGRGWTGAHPGTRATPTINSGRLYVMSGHGVVVCFNAETGQRLWSVDTMKKFGARQIKWGLTENLLIMGEKLIVTPGGEDVSVAALNKNDGSTIWTCRGVKDKSGYCSPIAVERGDRTVIAQLMSHTFIGVDAKDGTLLWRKERDPDPAYGIQAVPPVYQDGMFYVTADYGGQRGEGYRLNEDGTDVTRVWKNGELDCHHGGVIVHEGHVWGASTRNNRGNWMCLNLKNGDVAAEIRAVGKGSVSWADGMFYGYGENGLVGLITDDPGNFEMVSSFRIRVGKGPHWAHPSIADGRLYMRHGTYLMAYDIKAD